MTRQQPTQSTTRWATSKSGKLRIALAQRPDGKFAVWSLFKGTHDVAPGTCNSFTNETDARNYANQLWATR